MLQALHDLFEPPGALTAGGALAARLVGVEVGPARHRAHDRHRLVEDLQRPGAEHRAGRRDRVEVQRDVQMRVGEDRGRGAAGGPELEGVTLADAAGQLDQLTHGDAQRGLELAGIGHVPGEAEQAETGGLLGAHALEPVAYTHLDVYKRQHIHFRIRQLN